MIPGKLAPEILLVQRSMDIRHPIDVVAQWADLLSFNFVTVLEAVKSGVFGDRGSAHFKRDVVLVRCVLTDGWAVRSELGQRWPLQLRF